MPQMAPIMWVNMFFMMLSTLLIITIFNYFMTMINKSSPAANSGAKNNMKWEW